MDPATLALVTAGIGAAGSIGGGILSRPGAQKESKIEKQRRKLIDDLIRSLSGDGKYSDLYNVDEAAFQKSYVDPAKFRFSNQIAPQIQQQYIQSGQQRGTGLDDQLLRAGVDLDQLLNSAYMEYIQQGLNRKQNTISNIMGVGGGAQPGMSTGSAAQQAAGGYLTSDAFGDAINSIFGSNKGQQQSQINNPYVAPARKGYEQDSRYGLPSFDINAGR